MDRSDDRLKRTVDILARIIAGVVFLSLPGLFFAFGYQNQTTALDTEAEINSRIVGSVIAANPEMWKYEGLRLSDLLARRPRKRHHESRRIVDIGGRTIAESTDKLDSPVITRSVELFDSGTVVGRIEISRSLRPTMENTALAGVVGALLGLAVFATLRILPWRALREALDSLAREKERAQVTLHSIADGVITTGVSGEIEMINDVGEKLTGWKRDDAAGRRLEEVFHVLDVKTRERCVNPVEKVLKGGNVAVPAHFNVLVSRHGVERLVSDVTAPILDSRGRLLGAVLVFRDVTEKVMIEEERLKGRKLESLGILAGGIAHDFNNYLAGILGNISLAKLSVEPESKAYGRLNDAEKASMRAKELASKLLTFSKGGKPVRKPVEVGEIIRDAARLAVMGSDIKCEFRFEGSLWAAEADGGQVGQVISNLVINAVQAVPRDGIVKIAGWNATVSEGEVSYVKPGDYVRIDVEDHGAGIAKENLSKVFDPYFTTKKTGNGLGLATSYTIMKSHGGNIFVESAEGVGTVFHLYFPAMRNVLLSAKEKEEETALRGKGKILVMDDEALILDVASGMLEHLGYKPSVAKDGAEAIEMCIREAACGRMFDAVIMDLTVPGGMGGKEAVKRLLYLYPDVKVIVSSGYSNDPVMAEYEKHGFKGVVAKPYRIEDLGLALSKVVHGNGEPCAPTA